MSSSYADQAGAVGTAADTEIAGLNAQIVDLKDQLALAMQKVAEDGAALDAANATIAQQKAQIAALQAQVGVKSLVGIYIAGGAAGVGSFETWLGRPVDLVHTYTAATGGAPSWGSTKYASMMVISLDMLSGFSFADVIAGKADATFTAFGNKLVAAHMANAIIRLGWEYNGSWMKWSMANAGSAANWKAAFRRVVAALRKATGQKFKFEWNLAQGKTWDAASYPGTDVVDYHGADTYAGYTTAGVVHYNTPASRDDWFNGKAASAGKPAIPSWVEFAKNNGKPTAVSEWGAWEKDDAAYCTEMLGRFKSWGNLAYQIPFNVKGVDGIEHRFPVPYSGFGAAFLTGVH